MATTHERLLCKLDDSEVNARANDLARTFAARDEAKAKHTAAVAERKAAVDLHESRCKELARIVTDRAEHRLVECVEQHAEDTHEVLTIRTDTGEVLRRRPMTAEERQPKLFEISGGGKKGKKAASDETPGA